MPGEPPAHKGGWGKPHPPAVENLLPIWGFASRERSRKPSPSEALPPNRPLLFQALRDFRGDLSEGQGGFQNEGVLSVIAVVSLFKSHLDEPKVGIERCGGHIGSPEL